MTALDRLDELAAEVVLLGHGDPWHDGLGRALEVARESY